MRHLLVVQCVNAPQKVVYLLDERSSRSKAVAQCVDALRQVIYLLDERSKAAGKCAREHRLELRGIDSVHVIF
jgi:hypothetical protein